MPRTAARRCRWARICCCRAGETIEGERPKEAAAARAAASVALHPTRGGIVAELSPADGPKPKPQDAARGHSSWERDEASVASRPCPPHRKAADSPVGLAPTGLHRGRAARAAQKAAARGGRLGLLEAWAWDEPFLVPGECPTLAGVKLGVCSCPLQEPVDRSKERIQRRAHDACRTRRPYTGASAIRVSDVSYRGAVPRGPLQRLTRVMVFRPGDARVRR